MSILSLQNISLKKQQHLLLNNISFTVNKGEHWILVGQSGSGKTVLLNTLAGIMPPTAGVLTFAQNIKHNIALVTSKHHFTDKTNTSTNLYYQQRYNSSDSDQALTVSAYLASKQSNADAPHIWTTHKVSALLKLEHLLDKELIKLSNGETKRLRIASALLTQPEVLLLDDPLSGLDQQTQGDFSVLLEEIISTGVTIIMSGSGHEIPSPITHAAVLEHGSIINTIPVAKYSPTLSVQAQPLEREQLAALTADYQQEPFEWIVKMSRINIKYGDKEILHEVNWQIKPGEQWALSGHNGAGKSTLLSLINGDNPQAYANDIVLFDKKRGTGESIWDIKRNIGFVSPELYQYFPTDQSALQVVESGYYDTQGLFRPSNAAKAEKAMQCLKALSIDRYARQLLKNIPASAQRLCLLARAIIKNPPLLILDEPCQGLDQQQRLHFNSLIDYLVHNTGLTLIYVTHYMNELPSCISQTLHLENGRVVSV